MFEEFRLSMTEAAGANARLEIQQQNGNAAELLGLSRHGNEASLVDTPSLMAGKVMHKHWGGDEGSRNQGESVGQRHLRTCSTGDCDKTGSEVDTKIDNFRLSNTACELKPNFVTKREESTAERLAHNLESRAERAQEQRQLAPPHHAPAKADLPAVCLHGTKSEPSCEGRPSWQMMHNVSMQEQIRAERENVHFLSGSLSELTHAHTLEVQKLESSRAHCEDLAVELNERLTQREAEIVDLRKALAKAKLVSFVAQAEQYDSASAPGLMSASLAASATSSPTSDSTSLQTRGWSLGGRVKAVEGPVPSDLSAVHAVKKRMRRKIELRAKGDARPGSSSDDEIVDVSQVLGESILDRKQLSERRSSEIKEQVRSSARVSER